MSASGAAAARKHSRLPTLLTAGLLALSACGGSSGGKSTQSSTTVPPASSSGGLSARSTATASASTANTVTASVGGVSATLYAGTHHPRVNRPWPIRFIVTRAGRGARASVSYEYLFAGQVVARRSHYTFTGHFSDVFLWPSSAVGYPLTFRAVIVSGASTINLDYSVQVIT